LSFSPRRLGFAAGKRGIAMTQPIIRLEGVSKFFGTFQALRDVDLVVALGERMVVCGPSGSGKSTLIRCINRLEEHDAGRITVDGTELDDDTRHICPLQLEVIRRCVLLYSNPGEIVFSPFTGIGSEGFVALGGKSPKTRKQIKDARRFYGCELKPEYHTQAVKNLNKAIDQRNSVEKQESLFA
jgi:energy-coupling factor transporter ATP-binding protein EcfA2